MSFEGYYQLLCPKGHYWTQDAYAFMDTDDSCPDCGAAPTWQNLVDETNGPGVGYVDLELAEPAKTETCPACGRSREAKPAEYKIPGK